MIDLDQEEREILQAFEAGEIEPVADRESELKKHREYAEATFKKDKRITIRISSRDLNALRKRALVEGIPYQTLVTSVLHKYVNRQLVEKQPID
ncbi:MAG: antitoxin [Chloroflexi bacterium]|nr:antitoxin [Chloroflexota bacterium]